MLVEGGVTHGYDMRRELAARRLEVDYPSVYRMLGSLQRDGQVRSRWGSTVAGPRRRLYHITPAGRDRLAEIAGRLTAVSQAHDTFFEEYAQAADRHESASLATRESGSDLLALDHLALSLADPGALAAFLCDHAGMQELARSADGMLVGADPCGAKLRLIPVGGPTEPGALARVFLRVRDLERAVASLPADTESQMDGARTVTFQGPQQLGLGFTLMTGRGIDYDMDHVVLRTANPAETAIVLAELGCVVLGDTVHLAHTRIILEELPAWSDRPLLDHIAIRGGALRHIAAQARRRGLEIDERRADDTVTVVLPGPERIRVQFVGVGEPRRGA